MGDCGEWSAHKFNHIAFGATTCTAIARQTMRKGYTEKGLELNPGFLNWQFIVPGSTEEQGKIIHGLKVEQSKSTTP